MTECLEFAQRFDFYQFAFCNCPNLIRSFKSFDLEVLVAGVPLAYNCTLLSYFTFV